MADKYFQYCLIIINNNHILNLTANEHTKKFEYGNAENWWWV